MRYLLYLPGIIFLLLPFIHIAMKESAAERERREKEAQRAAIAEQKRIEAEQKQAEREAKAAEREQVKAAREAERQRKQAARLEIARQRAEYAERELAAKRELKAMQRAESIPVPAEPPKTPAEPVEQAQPAKIERPAPPKPSTEASAKQTEPASAAKQDAGETSACRQAVALGVKGNNAFAGHRVAFTGRLPGMTRREAIQAVEANGGRGYEKLPVGTTLLVVGENPGMCKMDKADEWIGQVRKITAAQFFEMLQQPLTLEPEQFAALYAAKA